MSNNTDKKCPDTGKDPIANRVWIALNNFMDSPSEYKDDVRKTCEKILANTSTDPTVIKTKSDLKNLIENCEDALNSNDKAEKSPVLMMILTLYIESQNVFKDVPEKNQDEKNQDKYVPCLLEAVNIILATPKILKQITCDFLPKKPFFETPLGIAVIVGGSVLLLAIIILIVMNANGGKRRRRK
jgi:hypothetical protein